MGWDNCQVRENQFRSMETLESLDALATPAEAEDGAQAATLQRAPGGSQVLL